MSQPLVHVLVINWNGLEHLEACFASLLESSYENVRYVLVDNASGDGSVDYVRSHFGTDPRVEILVCPENLGWSGGNNLGMQRALDAAAKYIFLLNNDTAVEPDTLELLVASAEHWSIESPFEVVALAPKMLMFDQPEILNSTGLDCSIIGAAWDRNIGGLDGPARDVEETVIGVCGGAMFLPAEVLRKTGLLPEDFEIYMDDLDLCLRIWSAGFQIWTCPEARVRHKFSASMGQGARARYKYYLNTRNRFRVVLRNFPLSEWTAILPAVLRGEARAVGRALLDSAPWRVFSHVRAWADALAYLPRAWRHRREQRRAGLNSGRFWPLICKSPKFCPAVYFPEDGWYPERKVEGRLLRPMAVRAHLEAAAGHLRVFHGNCYPFDGETRITVSMDGEELGELCSGGLDEVVLEVAAGRLDFHALKIFNADDTGELVDLGGWIAVIPED